MIRTLQEVLVESWQRLGDQIRLVLPNGLAMVLILAAGWVAARLVQWALHRMSRRLETVLRRWGVSAVLDDLGHGRAADLCARGAFWIVFGCAILMGINALDTELGSRLVTGAFLYLPNLVTAALIVLVGTLLGRFLARSALIWAVNEGIGPARWIAGGVRVGVGLLTVVAAAEQLGVARTAVLATFVILLSGTVLALALAVGLGGRKRMEMWLDRRASFLEEERREQKIEHL
jgi:hypothetical protein